LSISKVEPWVSFYVLYPGFIEGEGESVVDKIMHEFELAIKDKFIQGKNFEVFEVWVLEGTLQIVLIAFFCITTSFDSDVGVALP